MNDDPTAVFALQQVLGDVQHPSPVYRWGYCVGLCGVTGGLGLVTKHAKTSKFVSQINRLRR